MKERGCRSFVLARVKYCIVPGCAGSRRPTTGVIPTGLHHSGGSSSSQSSAPRRTGAPPMRATPPPPTMLDRRAPAADRLWRRAGDPAPVRRWQNHEQSYASNIFIHLISLAVVQ
jgi:hypothetical protein